MTNQSWAASPGTRRSMLGNTRRDTKPEIALRSLLHARGRRFRVDFRLDAAGTRTRPDIVFTKARVAVFVDGCFWHGCVEHRATRPKTNAEYWSQKIERNIARDLRQTSALSAAGWTVVRVWEHENPNDAADRVESVLPAIGRA